MSYKYSIGQHIIHRDQKYKVWSRYKIGNRNTYMLFSIPEGNFRTVKESEI